jgi:hypothetical protein
MTETFSFQTRHPNLNILSVGDVFNFDNLTYGGNPFNTTLISYYDKIDDFNFSRLLVSSLIHAVLL